MSAPSDDVPIGEQDPAIVSASASVSVSVAPPSTARPSISFAPEATSAASDSVTVTPINPPASSAMLDPSPNLAIREGAERIQVGVRLRPLNPRELSSGQTAAFRANIKSNAVTQVNPPSTTVHVDRVFDEAATNDEVYTNIAKPIVQSATLTGINGTIFAYGQTSSGKTYTMKGVIARAVEEMFAMAQARTDRTFMFKMSYIEIYNEQIKDLLTANGHSSSSTSSDLQIREDLDRGVFIAGLREEVVSSREQIESLIAQGEESRHVGATAMNEHSSRSHTIFRIVITSRLNTSDATSSSSSSSSSTPKSRGELGSTLTASLQLVDLAGSERAAQTMATGTRLKEGGHINKSLLTLASVIRKLSEDPRGHIPYRDSKLTRILQPALGGNNRTAIICCVTSASAFQDETLSTLRFAQRAKNVVNALSVNECVDSDLLHAAGEEANNLIRKLKNELATLKRKLRMSDGTGLLQSNNNNQAGGSVVSLSPRKRARHSVRYSTYIPMDETVEEEATESTPVAVAASSEQQVAVVDTQVDSNVESLRNELDGVRNELMEVMKERDEMSMQLSASDEKRQYGMFKHAAELAEMRSTLMEDADYAINQVATLQDELKNVKREHSIQLASLQSDLNMVQSKLSQLQTDVAEKDALLASKNAELFSINDQLSALSTSLANKDVSMAKLTDQLQAIKAEKEHEIEVLTQQLQVMKDGYARELDNLRMNVFVSQSRLDACYVSLMEKDAALSASHAQVKELNEAITSKDGQIASLNQQLSMRQQELGSKASDEAKWNEQLVELRDVITTKESEISGLKEQLQLVKDDRIKQMDAVQSNLAEAQSKLGALTAALSEKDAELVASRGQVEKMNESMASKDAELSSLNQQLSNLTSLVANKDALLVSKDSELTALNEQVSALASSITNNETLLASKERELSSLKDQLASLNSSLATKDADIADLTERVSTLEAENARLEKMIPTEKMIMQLVKAHREARDQSVKQTTTKLLADKQHGPTQQLQQQPAPESDAPLPALAPLVPLPSLSATSTASAASAPRGLNALLRPPSSSLLSGSGSAPTGAPRLLKLQSNAHAPTLKLGGHGVGGGLLKSVPTIGGAAGANKLMANSTQMRMAAEGDKENAVNTH